MGKEAKVMLLFARYWERGVKVAESVGVYVYAVIRRGTQVCYAICHVICVHNSSLAGIIMLVVINL